MCCSEAEHSAGFLLRLLCRDLSLNRLAGPLEVPSDAARVPFDLLVAPGNGQLCDTSGSSGGTGRSLAACVGRSGSIYFGSLGARGWSSARGSHSEQPGGPAPSPATSASRSSAMEQLQRTLTPYCGTIAVQLPVCSLTELAAAHGWSAGKAAAVAVAALVGLLVVAAAAARPLARWRSDGLQVALGSAVAPPGGGAQASGSAQEPQTLGQPVNNLQPAAPGVLHVELQRRLLSLERQRRQQGRPNVDGDHQPLLDSSHSAASAGPPAQPANPGTLAQLALGWLRQVGGWRQRQQLPAAAAADIESASLLESLAQTTRSLTLQPQDIAFCYSDFGSEAAADGSLAGGGSDSRLPIELGSGGLSKARLLLCSLGAAGGLLGCGWTWAWTWTWGATVWQCCALRHPPLPLQPASSFCRSTWHASIARYLSPSRCCYCRRGRCPAQSCRRRCQL